MFFKSFESVKFKLIRFVERNYKINLLIYNNINYFKFLLPHEKDFYGMLLLCDNHKNKVILDIGANLGISSLGFRKLGFRNKIYAFEPNYNLFSKFLKKIKRNNKDLYIKNIALGHINGTKKFFMPHYDSKCLHYFCSFDLKYLLNSIKIAFPNLINKIIIKEKKIMCRKFDSLNLDIIPHFIKIDAEGYDEFILKGMKKTIQKHKPIFLIEYNKEYFVNVKKILKGYTPFFYDLKKNKMIKLPYTINSKKISRISKFNYLSVRNIFFLPKKNI